MNIRNITGFFFVAVCLSLGCRKESDRPSQTGVDHATIDSLIVYPGDERVEILWLKADSASRSAEIKWTNRSYDVDLSDRRVGDTVKVWIDSLRDGAYLFNITTFDVSGNVAGQYSVQGNAYGDVYRSALANDSLEETSLEDSKLKVVWGQPDSTAIGTEITYQDKAGMTRRLLVSADSTAALLENVDLKDTIWQRAMYKPEALSIDTFYSARQPVDPPPVYDESGCLYTSYHGLVMAGYQGWFSAEGDEDGRGWYHYKGACGFTPGCTAVDMWPDMAEYAKKYVTPFKYADGKPAYLYSAYDEETIDLHFKWMKDYGIDGVFLQRFVSEIKDSSGKKHFNAVLDNALKAARKYGRSICIMYDLSGCTSADMAVVVKDWNELQEKFALFDNKENPTYLRENHKPLLAIWGVGFNDDRQYTTEDVMQLVDQLKGYNNKISVMLGVPYYWRTLNHDAQASPELLTLVKKCDAVMPWAVGRYTSASYSNAQLSGDEQWCEENHIEYIPCVLPGYSWGNLSGDAKYYNYIPRDHGDFLWKQVAGAKKGGAASLYVAMFDEIDEGTAIYKCENDDHLPLNGDKQFVGIENDLSSDYYLWLTGQAASWFHGEGGFGDTKPVR